MLKLEIRLQGQSLRVDGADLRTGISEKMQSLRWKVRVPLTYSAMTRIDTVHRL